MYNMTVKNKNNPDRQEEEAMKKYCAVKENTYISCGSRRKVDEFIAANPGYSPEEHHEWKSSEMGCVLGHSRDTIQSETGIEWPLESAIEQNWERIIRAARMFGLSGYNIKSVRIRREGPRCIITIKGWNCSEILVGFDPASDWSEKKLLTRTVTFDGVEDGDLHADDFMVDLVSGE